MQSIQSTITFSNTFRGLKAYSKEKSAKGLYVNVVEKVFQILKHGLHNYQKPRAAHLVIDSPKLETIKSLPQDLERFLLQRNKPVDAQSKPNFVYLYVVEKRPRSKKEHLHLLVVADGLDALDLRLLSERLVKFSSTRKVKIQQRRFDCLPLAICENTGEIRLNRRGEYARKGSVYFHDLRWEFEDAFERLTYFAKVLTKPEYAFLSCSRYIDPLAHSNDDCKDRVLPTVQSPEPSLSV